MNTKAHCMSIECGIINYNSKFNIFSELEDLGAIIANIHGHINGLLTNGASKTKSFNIMYTTPLLAPLLHNSGLSDMNLNVFE